MENTTPTTHENSHMTEFISASQEMMEQMIAELGLHMTVRDLRYCQNQYRMRERRNPDTEELFMLDALFVQRTHHCGLYGLRSLYTSDPMIAQSYADLMAKATHTQREARPYTPIELSGVLTKTLRQAGKNPSVPGLCVGKASSLRLLPKGMVKEIGIKLEKSAAVIGRSAAGNSHDIADPKPSDHILLIMPSGLTPAAFAETVATLSIPKGAETLVIGEKGLLEALLTWEGVYIVQSYLPYMSETAPLSELVSAYKDSILIRCDGEDALRLRDHAAANGLTASIIGKYAINQRLTIRRQNQSPFQLETAFLRSFSPTFPTDVEIPGLCVTEEIYDTTTASQTVVEGGDSTPFASAINGTAYACSSEYILTGAASYPAQNPFRASMLTTIHAINRIVASGVDYNEITLSNHLIFPPLADRNAAMSETMAAFLGAYRVQAELAIPDVGGALNASEEDTERASLTVFAASPKPKNMISHYFRTVGSNVYLLAPLSTAESPVDFEDYRKLLHYVYALCRDGVAESAIAVGAEGVEKALETMTQSGYGFSATMPLPNVTLAFLIETKQVIQGSLLGITTASPMIRIGEKESQIVRRIAPPLSPEHAPMSDVGVDQPILCIPRTCHVGSLSHLHHFADQHHAILKTPMLNRPNSRTQLTEFANTLTQANIAVLVGTEEELTAIAENPRVAYAKQEMLKRGGLMLYLHTDLTSVKNASISPDHPFFFGVPKSLYEKSAIRFEDEACRVVHMRADSVAIRQMLICGLAYFQ